MALVSGLNTSSVSIRFIARRVGRPRSLRSTRQRCLNPLHCAEGRQTEGEQRRVAISVSIRFIARRVGRLPLPQQLVKNRFSCPIFHRVGLLGAHGAQTNPE